MTPPHRVDDELTLPGGIKAKGRAVFAYLGYILAVGVALYALARPSLGDAHEAAKLRERMASIETDYALTSQKLTRIEADLAEMKGDLKQLLRGSR